VKENHSSNIFFGVLVSVLDNFSIRNRILVVTIDNVSNNNKFIKFFNQKFRSSITEIFGINLILYIFCLIYVIQLVVKIMMGRLNIEIKNDSKEVNWERNKIAEEIKKAIGIARTLAKICHDQYNDLIILIKISD
jgi:uncharacterized membrane protein